MEVRLVDCFGWREDPTAYIGDGVLKMVKIFMRLIMKMEIDLEHLEEKLYGWESSIMSTIAHEIAHFILGHGGICTDPDAEKRADDLTETWGFRRAYESYEMFARKRSYEV